MTSNCSWAGPETEALRERLAATAKTPNKDGRGLVSSYAIGDGDRLLLFDPLAVPPEIEELAAGREPVVVLTSPWHERDMRSLVERLDAPVFTPPPDGSPDVAWLLAEPRSGPRLLLGWRSAARRSRGVPRKVAQRRRAVLESSRAVIAGDTLVDFGQGLEIPVEWLPAGVTREQVANGLEMLLDLPVEVVLATHGGPTDRAALVRALV